MVLPIIFLISLNYPAEKVKPESKKDRVGSMQEDAKLSPQPRASKAVYG
jgi:hypothetical protein